MDIYVKVGTVGVCAYCSVKVRLNAMGLWVDNSLVFPQYCEKSEQANGGHLPILKGDNE